MVIDNASFHKSDQIRKLVEDAKCSLKFLPSYSPDLNPIENYWAVIKARIKKIKKKFENINEAIDQVLQV